MSHQDRDEDWSEEIRRLRQRELRHLRHGPGDDEPQWMRPVWFRACCSGNAPIVLARAKEVLETVLAQDVGRWPPQEEWRRVLPAWFVAACERAPTAWETEQCLRPEKRNAEHAKHVPWSLPAWVRWFEPDADPDERFWMWWDARVEGPNTLLVALEVEGRPFPWGTLDWLLRAAGASEVKETPPPLV